VAAKKRALLKKPTWDEFFAKKDANSAKPYEFREHYRENVIVSHPKFGPGFVSEIVSDSKVEITFQDARRILVHNRRDIPGLPLAAEGDGTPTPAHKPAKVAKDGAKAAAAQKAAAAKPAPKPMLVPPPPAPKAAAEKTEPKAGKAAKPVPVKAAKAAAPRGGKTAAKPAAKKPPPKAKKKAGKKR
jgi:hypothetical protein